MALNNHQPTIISHWFSQFKTDKNPSFFGWVPAIPAQLQGSLRAAFRPQKKFQNH